MNTVTTAAPGPGTRWCVAGDWNGFFGLFTNVLLNVIVLTTLCLFVVQLPADTVYGRVLPALGIALPLGNLFYAYLAFQLAKKEGRTDVDSRPASGLDGFAHRCARLCPIRYSLLRSCTDCAIGNR